jgi:hypothetical protein
MMHAEVNPGGKILLFQRFSEGKVNTITAARELVTRRRIYKSQRLVVFSDNTPSATKIKTHWERQAS